MRKTILFDLDGTLLDTAEDLTAACNYAMSTLGYGQYTADEIKTMVGDGVRMLMTRALKDHLSDLDSALELFRGWYSEHAAEHTFPYPGIVELLERLRRDGYEMGVVSNKPQYAVYTLVRRFFPEIEICVGDAPGRRVKPAPDLCEAAMLSLDTDKSDCVYVGDSEIDLLTAKNLGIPCIAAAWGFRGRKILESNGAEYIADTPAQVLEILGGYHAF